MQLRILSIVLLSFVAFGNSAHASLIGDDVLIEWVFPDSASNFTADTVTVGAGAEVVCNNPGTFTCSFGGYGADSVFIDVAGFSAGMTFTNGATTFQNPSFNGFRFSDLDFSDASTLVGVVLSTNIVGLDMSRVAFGADFAEINLAGLQTSESFWTMDFITSNPVPAPAPLALLALGLLGIGYSRRNKTA